MTSGVPHLSQTPAFFGGFMKMWYTVSSFGHTRRPVSRLMSSSGSRNKFPAASSFVNFESASACASVRGNPSRMNPFFASGSLSRRSVIAITRSSGTSPPASMYAFAFFPSSDRAVTLCRKMSPVETWGTPRYAASFVAWVPLPAPGGPRRTSRMRMAENGMRGQKDFGLTDSTRGLRPRSFRRSTAALGRFVLEFLEHRRQEVPHVVFARGRRRCRRGGGLRHLGRDRRLLGQLLHERLQLPERPGDGARCHDALLSPFAQRAKFRLKKPLRRLGARPKQLQVVEQDHCEQRREDDEPTEVDHIEGPRGGTEGEDQARDDRGAEAEGPPPMPPVAGVVQCRIRARRGGREEGELDVGQVQRTERRQVERPPLPRVRRVEDHEDELRRDVHREEQAQAEREVPGAEDFRQRAAEVRIPDGGVPTLHADPSESEDGRSRGRTRARRR